MRSLATFLISAVLAANSFAGDPVSRKSGPLDKNVPADVRQILTNWSNIEVDRRIDGWSQMEIHRDFARMILTLHDQDRLNIVGLWGRLGETQVALQQVREQLADLQWQIADAEPDAVILHVGHGGDPLSASVRVDHVIDPNPARMVTGSGSGTVVSVENGRALVITNHHVCPHDGEIYCVFADGTRGRALFLGSDESVDLAGLAILDPAKLPVPQKVDPCPPASGPVEAAVEQFGYSKARAEPLRRLGRLLSRQARCDHYVLKTADGSDTTNGDSGSGIFVKGELVGTVWGGTPVDVQTGRQILDQGQTVSSAVKPEDINRFCATGERAKLFPLLAARSAACNCGPAPGGVGTCGSYACPANGGKGPCPCDAAALEGWHPGTDGSGDYGWYEHGVFKGRWFARTHTYHVYDGKAYAEKGTPLAVRETPPPPVRPIYFGGFGGGCSGGRCH